MKKLYVAEVYDIDGYFNHTDGYYAENLAEAEKIGLELGKGFHPAERIDRVWPYVIDDDELEYPFIATLRKGNVTALRLAYHYNPGNNSWVYIPGREMAELMAEGYKVVNWGDF